MAGRQMTDAHFKRQITSMYISYDSANSPEFSMLVYNDGHVRIFIENEDCLILENNMAAIKKLLELQARGYIIADEVFEYLLREVDDIEDFVKLSKELSVEGDIA